MNEYDVIVVGAGSAGCSAAKEAAVRGAKTIVLEEHQAIGVPIHCTGRIQGSSFTQEIMAGLDQNIILTEYRIRRVFAPSGQIVQEIPIAGRVCCMVRRDEFDREIARQAVKAGATILLNTQVSGLIKEGGKVRGVATNSAAMPEVYGKVVISADSRRGAQMGIPRQEGLTWPDEKFKAGILFELEGVKGLEPDVLETHITALIEKRFVSLWPRSSTSCFTGFASLEEFERVKQGNALISSRLKDAVPLRMYGYVSGSMRGEALPRCVKDGVMLVGDAAGYTGMIHAVVSGRYAGVVAAQAIREGDVGEQRLSQYQKMCRQAGIHLTHLDSKPLQKLVGLSDDAIEKLLPEMAQKNELGYQDQLPF